MFHYTRLTILSALAYMAKTAFFLLDIFMDLIYITKANFRFLGFHIACIFFFVAPILFNCMEISRSKNRKKASEENEDESKDDWKKTTNGQITLLLLTLTK